MSGQKITISNGKLTVPNNPVIPFIEGDGTGPDIWASSVRVLDAAVEKAYGGTRKIEWREVLAGEKAFNQTQNWLPQETLDVINEYLVAIKGPLTTPVGGGIRSLNVALRQQLDLYHHDCAGAPDHGRTGSVYRLPDVCQVSGCVAARQTCAVC